MRVLGGGGAGPGLGGRVGSSAGAPSELWLARGTVHAFLNNAAAASRRDAGLDKAAAYLRAHLYGS